MVGNRSLRGSGSRICCVAYQLGERDAIGEQAGAAEERDQTWGQAGKVTAKQEVRSESRVRRRCGPAELMPRLCSLSRRWPHAQSTNRFFAPVLVVLPLLLVYVGLPAEAARGHLPQQRRGQRKDRGTTQWPALPALLVGLRWA